MTQTSHGDSLGSNSQKIPFKFSEYIKSVQAELGHVTWPDRPVVVRSVLTIIGICAIVSLMIAAIDYVLTAALVHFNQLL
jgi:preprotein translocase SecE subunit